jgi:hypothetical protein
LSAALMPNSAHTPRESMNPLGPSGLHPTRKLISPPCTPTLRSCGDGKSVKLEPERFFDVDEERVLVFIHVTAEGEVSGAPVEMHDAHELTVRDGLIARLKVYADRTEALKAAGLSE